MYTFGHWNDASLILKQITISDCGVNSTYANTF